MKRPEPIPLAEPMRRLLDEAVVLTQPADSERERVWRRLARTLERPSRRSRARWWSAAGLATACALALLWGLVARRPAPLSAVARVVEHAVPAPRELPSPPSPSPSPSLPPSLPPPVRALPEVRLALRSGHFAVDRSDDEPPQSIEIVTPRVTVRGASRRFAVYVEAGQTRVVVHEGVLHVLSADAGAEVEVGAGETVTSADPRLTPCDVLPHPRVTTSHPLDRQATFEACRALDDDRADACYAGLADGQDLVAANALFALAARAHKQHQPDEALRQWRRYLARFPTGMLAPEAALGLVETCLAAGLTDDARLEADRFVVRYPDHPAAAKVRQLRSGPLAAP